MDRQECIYQNGHEKANLTARLRWKLLAKVLHDASKNGSWDSDHSENLNSPLLCTSTSYGLFKCSPLGSNESCHEKCGNWFRYVCDISPGYSLSIRHLPKRISLTELAGFNNTGNLGVWPSEEVLAYYCLKNSLLFEGKNVLELGGGMTCLASLTVAATSAASSVCCTDGNSISVDNLHQISQRNDFKDCSVSVKLLDWKDESTYTDMLDKWDVVLCADCLFFDDGRAALLETMWRTTTNNGLILVMAPRRGRTLNQFLQLCRGKFQVYVDEDYDADVMLRHQKKLACSDYNPDVQYPILVQLRKC